MSIEERMVALETAIIAISSEIATIKILLEGQASKNTCSTDKVLASKEATPSFRIPDGLYVRDSAGFFTGLAASLLLIGFAGTNPALSVLLLSCAGIAGEELIRAWLTPGKKKEDKLDKLIAAVERLAFK